MSKSITQDMAYRQSLMKYAEKYGVGRASRKYNKIRSYIYFWKKRWDGTPESLVCQSRRLHSHPNQHTEAELKLIYDMRRRNPQLGHGGALAPAAVARLYPSPGKPVSSDAETWDVPIEREETRLQAQAL